MNCSMVVCPPARNSTPPNRFPCMNVQRSLAHVRYHRTSPFGRWWHVIGPVPVITSLGCALLTGTGVWVSGSINSPFIFFLLCHLSFVLSPHQMIRCLPPCDPTRCPLAVSLLATEKTDSALAPSVFGCSDT